MAKGKSPQDALAVELMDIFKWAFNKAIPDLQRLEQFQNMYDNVASEDDWPTNSKMPIPLHFASVEENLAGAMEYLFPGYGFIRLTPMEPGVSMDQVRNSERALHDTLVRRMKVQHNSYPTVRDCFKLGVGYGIVEPFSFTPPVSAEVSVVRKNRKVVSSRIMKMSARRAKGIRFRHISTGQIIVTPDGSDFNGHSRPSWAFFTDLYKESDINDLYNDSPVDSDGRKILKGSPAQLIKGAKDKGFNSTIPAINYVAALAGLDIRVTNSRDAGNPVLVPIVKCYSPNRHVWIANGDTVILDQESLVQTFRTPLVKCSAWPEGNRWYPMSSIEAAQKLAIGMNVWINAIFDLMTHIIKPTMLYNKNVIKSPDRGPQSDIGVTGNVSDAAKYMAPPDMPQALFSVGEFLAQHYGNAIGRKQFLQEVKPGLMRGGAFAFESLLQTSTGRERMAGAILETGYLQSIVEQTLIYMQLHATKKGESFIGRAWDRMKGDYIEQMTVTEDDLVHSFEVSVTLKEKNKGSMMDQQQRLALFSALKDNSNIDQYELLCDLIMDEERERRLVFPKEEVIRMQAENRELEMRERLMNSQPPPAPETEAPPAMTGAEQMPGMAQPPEAA